MKFTLDYTKLINLDAEDLAEVGIKNAYQSLLKALRQYVSEPAQVEEIIDNDAPNYVVKCCDQEYVIYSPGLPEEEGQNWGRATNAFFKIVNDQLNEIGIPLLRDKWWQRLVRNVSDAV
jgi:hypothetical protein